MQENLNINNIVNQVIQTGQKKGSQASITLLKDYLSELQNNTNTLNNLALRFYQQVEYELAKTTFEFAIKNEPRNHSLYNNLGLCLNRLGHGKNAVKHYQTALELKPDYHQARSNLAYTLLYFGTTGRQEILEEHKKINQYVFPNSHDYLKQRSVSKLPDRKIRIAYVSADLRNHAVGTFMTGILKSHDKASFDVYIFDNRKNNVDAKSIELQELQKQWVNISKKSTEQVCQLIVKLQIDILIDLSGHTKGGRPDIFSQRTAPVQLSYLGYPATTGLEKVDYRLGDDFSDLPIFDSQCSEQVLRMPHAMWNYTPWHDLPIQPTASPVQTSGRIVFGSANNHAKLQEPWLKVWSQVLNAVPNSQLSIKSRSLNSPTAKQQLFNFFQNHKIQSNRINIVNYSPNKNDHWRALQSFDIALDSFPYNGTTTTCDLLNLGIPIVTRAGNSHVSRTTGSILNTLGLSSWIASSEKEFIQICIDKSNDIYQLKKLRQSLHDRFSSSTLGNPKLFLIAYEQQLKETWKTYCSKKD